MFGDCSPNVLAERIGSRATHRAPSLNASLSRVIGAAISRPPRIADSTHQPTTTTVMAARDRRCSAIALAMFWWNESEQDATRGFES
jgi:hypothetical protein